MIIVSTELDKIAISSMLSNIDKMNQLYELKELIQHHVLISFGFQGNPLAGKISGWYTQGKKFRSQLENKLDYKIKHSIEDLVSDDSIPLLIAIFSVMALDDRSKLFKPLSQDDKERLKRAILDLACDFGASHYLAPNISLKNTTSPYFCKIGNECYEMSEMLLSKVDNSHIVLHTYEMNRGGRYATILFKTDMSALSEQGKIAFTKLSTPEILTKVGENEVTRAKLHKDANTLILNDIQQIDQPSFNVLLGFEAIDSVGKPFNVSLISFLSKGKLGIIYSMLDTELTVTGCSLKNEADFMLATSPDTHMQYTTPDITLEPTLNGSSLYDIAIHGIRFNETYSLKLQPLNSKKDLSLHLLSYSSYVGNEFFSNLYKARRNDTYFMRSMKEKAYLTNVAHASNLPDVNLTTVQKLLDYIKTDTTNVIQYSNIDYFYARVNATWDSMSREQKIQIVKQITESNVNTSCFIDQLTSNNRNSMNDFGDYQMASRGATIKMYKFASVDQLFSWLSMQPIIVQIWILTAYLSKSKISDLKKLEAIIEKYYTYETSEGSNKTLWTIVKH